MATNKVLIEGSSLPSVSHAQLKELHRQLDEGDLNGNHIQALLRHENPFSLDSVVIDWRAVYRKLGMQCQQEIPASPNHWIILVEKGVTMNRVVRTLRSLGVTVSLYTEDLDADVNKNDRDPASGSYVVRFQKTIEADPELASKSAETLVKEQVNGITLLERLLLELGYFMTTGLHLDIENWTLCTGSRLLDGLVPGVRWYTDDRKVYVGLGSPSGSLPGLRARAVVS